MSKLTARFLCSSTGLLKVLEQYRASEPLEIWFCYRVRTSSEHWCAMIGDVVIGEAAPLNFGRQQAFTLQPEEIARLKGLLKAMREQPIVLAYSEGDGCLKIQEITV